MSMTVRNPSVVVPARVGSCTLPNTPTSSATTAPAANAVKGTAMFLDGVLSSMGSGCSRPAVREGVSPTWPRAARSSRCRRRGRAPRRRVERGARRRGSPHPRARSSRTCAGRDHARQVEGAIAAVPAAVDRVLEQGPQRRRRRVVQLDPDDPVQRHHGEVGHRRVRTGHVPRVDDDAARLVTGVGDELQSVVQSLDVRPRKNSMPRRAPTPAPWSASPANLDAQTARSHGPSSPSGVTLRWRGSSTSAASRRR